MCYFLNLISIVLPGNYHFHLVAKKTELRYDHYHCQCAGFYDVGRALKTFVKLFRSRIDIDVRHYFIDHCLWQSDQWYLFLDDLHRQRQYLRARPTSSTSPSVPLWKLDDATARLNVCKKHDKSYFVSI